MSKYMETCKQDYMTNIRMKVCIISGSFPKMECGVGDHTFQLCNYLQNRTEINIITSANKLIMTNVPFINTTVYPIIEKWKWREIVKIIKLIRKIKPHIVHIQFPARGYEKSISMHIITLILRLFCRKSKIIVTLHEYSVNSIMGRLAKLLLILWSNINIIVSEKEIYKINRILPYMQKKNVYIPDGPTILPVKISDKHKIRKELSIEKDEIIISYFGFIYRDKGVKELLSSFNELLSQHENIKLLMIGGPFHIDKGEYFIKMKKLGEYLMINNKVIWTGFIEAEKVSQYLSISDIGVAPYRRGATGKSGALIVMLSHGLPVITTRIDKMPKEFIDGDNILLIEPMNIRQLVQKMNILIKSKLMRDRIGENAQKLSLQFSWDIVGKKTYDLYR